MWKWIKQFFVWENSLFGSIMRPVKLPCAEELLPKMPPLQKEDLAGVIFFGREATRRENKPLGDTAFQVIAELEQRIEALQWQNELLIKFVEVLLSEKPRYNTLPEMKKILEELQK